MARSSEVCRYVFAFHLTTLLTRFAAQMWYIGGYVFKTDPAARAARGEFHRDGWGYLAMVCVYLYGFIYCMTWQGMRLSFFSLWLRPTSTLQVSLGRTALKSSPFAFGCFAWR